MIDKIKGLLVVKQNSSYCSSITVCSCHPFMNHVYQGISSRRFGYSMFVKLVQYVAPFTFMVKMTRGKNRSHELKSRYCNCFQGGNTSLQGNQTSCGRVVIVLTNKVRCGGVGIFGGIWKSV